jgi:heme-degrading monooxygenase HmoA
MIIRIFRVRIKPELRTGFEKDFREISIPLIKSHSGLTSVSIGKPTKWAPDEYVMISNWRNETDLEDFVGKNWNQPVIPSGMEKYVVECWVHHYEIFG